MYDATIALTVDGTPHEVTVDTRTTLLDALRERLGVTSPKKGCDHGQCGACTVLIDGRRTLSCLSLAVAQDGVDVVTASGLGVGDLLHPVQQAVVDHDGLQCGYCTPGQVCSAVGMLAEAAAGEASHVTAPEHDPGDPVPLTDEEIRERMSGNLCRCGAYVNIVAAIREAAGELTGSGPVKPFTYERPRDAAAAVAAVSGHREVMYVAGGTNLVDHLKLGVATPDVLVDVSRLPMDRVEPLSGGGLRIGANVRNSDLAADVGVRRGYPALAQAVLAGASGQIRNTATTGGNLLQRTRCVYFQDVTTPCNKRDPGSGCPAREGFHRNLAILGASEHCVATHPSDLAVALVALDATVVVLGEDGERRVPIRELHRLPGDDPSRDTTLAHGELVTAVELPSPAPGRSAYRKVRDRASYAFALVSVAARLDLRDGVVHDVAIALGGVAHGPWRATTAEDLLRGRPATEESYRLAAEAELEVAEPLPDNAFKVPLVRNTLVATLRRLAAEPAGDAR